MNIKELDHINIIDGMERPSSDYTAVAIEFYHEVKSAKSSHIHARPVKGQDKFPHTLDATACRMMRAKSENLGVKFLVWGKINIRQGKGPYVYTHKNSTYQKVEF